MEKEDYLETIYELYQELGHIRVSDIAKALNLSKPSVTQMMQRLQKDQCIQYEPYQPIKLTPKGSKIGKKVAERHKVLAEFFTILDIPPRIQEKDIHGIEHYLSPITLKKLKEVSKFLKKNKY
jgi:Mn-dependent DtxR family transcriptional regulator